MRNIKHLTNYINHTKQSKIKGGTEKLLADIYTTINGINFVDEGHPVPGTLYLPESYEILEPFESLILPYAVRYFAGRQFTNLLVKHPSYIVKDGERVPYGMRLTTQDDEGNFVIKDDESFSFVETALTPEEFREAQSILLSWIRNAVDFQSTLKPVSRKDVIITLDNMDFMGFVDDDGDLRANLEINRYPYFLSEHPKYEDYVPCVIDDNAELRWALNIAQQLVRSTSK